MHREDFPTDDWETLCPIDLKPVLQSIVCEYALPLGGLHGVFHWARVLEIGLRLSAQSGANPRVVSLFSVFHDSRRINEGTDHGHGKRGAALAEKLRGVVFDLSDDEFSELHEACCQHTDVDHHQNVTVQTCFDSDRLDIGRCGFMPSEWYLNTAAAKDPQMVNWAHARARVRHQSTRVHTEWNIILPPSQNVTGDRRR